MKLKTAVAKAFLASSITLITGMVLATVAALSFGEAKGVEIFAAPLIGFYISLGVFICVFPAALIFFLLKRVPESKSEQL